MIRSASSIGRRPARVMRSRRDSQPEIRHGEPEEAVALAGVVDREDVRMNQSRRDPDFLEKAPGQLAAGPHGGMQHLERHDPVVPEVARLVHGRHAAGADLLADLVAGRRARRGSGRGARGRGTQRRSVGQSVSRSDSELLEVMIQVQHTHATPILPRHGAHGVAVGPGSLERPGGDLVQKPEQSAPAPPQNRSWPGPRGPDGSAPFPWARER